MTARLSGGSSGIAGGGGFLNPPVEAGRIPFGEAGGSGLLNDSAGLVYDDTTKTITLNGAAIDENTGFITVPGLIALTNSLGLRITNGAEITGDGTFTYFVPGGSSTKNRFYHHARFRRGENSATLQTGAGATGTIITVSPPDNAITTIMAWVTGGKDNEAEGAGYFFMATYRRTGGGAPIICGAVTAIHTGETDATANATLVIVGNNVEVQVTSPAGDIYDWAATVDVQDRT